MVSHQLLLSLSLYLSLLSLRHASRRVCVKETLVNRFRVARGTFNGVICNKLDALR